VPPAGLNLTAESEFWNVVGFAAVMLVIAELVTWLETVGDRERAERENLALLVRIGDAMSSAVGEDRALREVARLLVPSFADWSVLHLSRDGGRIDRVAVVHAEGEELERALLAAPAVDPDEERGVAAVIRTAKTERFESPAVEEVRDMTHDAEHLELVMRAGLGSSIVAPLVARDRTIGTLTLVRGTRRSGFTDRDVGFAEEIGERMALVIDNARLVDLERRSAGLNAVLQELTAALSASVSASDVGRTVVEQGARALGAAAAAFAVRRAEGRVELREAFGYPAEALERLGKLAER